MSWSDEDFSWSSDVEDVSNNGFDDESNVGDFDDDSPADFDDVSNDGVDDEAPHDFPDDVFSNNEASTVDVEDFVYESPPNNFSANAFSNDDDYTVDEQVDNNAYYQESAADNAEDCSNVDPTHDATPTTVDEY
jgi:hypothetical protein